MKPKITMRTRRLLGLIQRLYDIDIALAKTSDSGELDSPAVKGWLANLAMSAEEKLSYYSNKHEYLKEKFGVSNFNEFIELFNNLCHEFYQHIQPYLMIRASLNRKRRKVLRKIRRAAGR